MAPRTPSPNSPRDTEPRVFLALGSNLGDRRANFGRAATALADHHAVQLIRRSALYETEPVGGPAGQGPYLNAVVELATTLLPAELLDLALAIEQRLGRRRAEPNSPRTIDIDLLLYGAEVIDEPGLTIPHPRMATRRFVLEPLMEIAPDLVHPVLHRTAQQLLEALPQSEADVGTCRRIDSGQGDW